jgi:hypothetical protein
MAQKNENVFYKCVLETHFTSTVSPAWEAPSCQKSQNRCTLLCIHEYTACYDFLLLLYVLCGTVSHLEAAVFVAVRQSLLSRRSRREMNKGEILRLLHPFHFAVVAAGQPVEEGAQRLLGGGEHEVA